ncbi:MFS transporter [Xanthomonas sacchari]|uniref:MFS transporter n=1 Tax=Xanthomonas sacchari TaxID=56458 RepID=UPI00224CC7ED|nr:MFS transporter [Xanthomonas sacchari]MCW0451538.1 Multidrug resistance protein Stp [Xanthomonas sacchari]
MTSASPPDSTVLPRRGAALAAVCLAALALPLNFSGGAVATPAIGAALGGSALALAWITNAFMLSFGSLLLAAGALADRHGRRRVFLGGLALFASASLGVAVAGSVAAIDLWRALQGVGAAAALAAGTAALAQLYTGAARTRAFSLLGTTFGTGLAFGPLAAGALSERLGWRAIFFGVAAVAALACALAARWLPASRDPAAGPPDRAGALCFSAALALFTAGLIQGPHSGWGSAATLALLGAAALLLLAFVCIERRRSHPLLDLSLFRYRRFVGVQLLPVATCTSYVVVLLPLRMIGVDGTPAASAGLTLLALSAPMLLVPSLAAVLAQRIAPAWLSAAGLAAAAAGLCWLGARPPAQALPALLLIGAGTALPWGLMDALSVSVVPIERAGMAAGLFGTLRVAGEGIALASVAALLAALVQARLAAVAPLLPHATLANTAQRLVAGDLSASMAEGALSATQLRLAYAAAFGTLTRVLAAITALAAIAICLLLGRTPQDAVDESR